MRVSRVFPKYFGVAIGPGLCENLPMGYTREGKWIGPCGCGVCEKWADCDYCDGCSPRVMVANVVEVVRHEFGYDVDVTMASGFSESINGLYDIESALDYGRMHIGYQTNKYVRG